jgi:DNA-binding MarR family transcriptional regulator
MGYDLVMAVERLPAEDLEGPVFLLARHGAIINSRIRQAFEATGLTPRQAMTLMHLSGTGRMSQQALVEALGVDPSGLVAILNDLERSGLADRHRDPTDRRRHIVEITADGTAALAQIHEALGAVERELFADLDDEELTRLQGLLSRVRTTHDDPSCEGD